MKVPHNKKGLKMNKELYIEFCEIIKSAGMESAFVAHIKNAVEHNLGDEHNSIDDIPFEMLKEYFDLKFGGNILKAVVFWVSK